VRLIVPFATFEVHAVAIAAIGRFLSHFSWLEVVADVELEA
jgi:hypothetical protein